ncbi:hypothetical protein GCM10027429_17160 [Marivirga atlantica]|jgi:protein SCO1/2
MGSKKFFILLITISFPVLLYLFLRFYGQNEYDLPYFFKDNVEGCATSYANNRGSYNFLNYSNGDSINLADIFDDQLNLILFPDFSRDNQPLKNELNRTLIALKNKVDINVHAFNNYDSIQQPQELSLTNYQIANYSILYTTASDLKDCIFVLPTPSYKGTHPSEEIINTSETLVLLDDSLNIRGYYNAFETKDVDRLILEVNVLLSNR